MFRLTNVIPERIVFGSRGIAVYNVTFCMFLCMSWEVRLCTEVNVYINILLAFSLYQMLGPLLHIQGGCGSNLGPSVTDCSWLSLVW